MHARGQFFPSKQWKWASLILLLATTDNLASFSNRAISSTFLHSFFLREIIVKWSNVIMNDEKWLIGDKIRSERRCQTFRAKLLLCSR